MEFNKFERRAPSHQNAVDIFKDRWASSLDTIAPGTIAGDAPHFAPTELIGHGAKFLGNFGRFDRMSILELGPLDGGKTYQIENLGGDVVAIEANAEAFLKCLIVKEIARMRSRFLFGNFIPYLEETTDRFDIVVAVGMLYHMTDPISVIQSIARVSNKCLVWSATYDETCPQAPKVAQHNDPRYPDVDLFTVDYGGTQSGGRFWGGIDPTSTWMRGEDMIRVFERAGYSNIERLHAPSTEFHGAVSFSAWK